MIKKDVFIKAGIGLAGAIGLFEGLVIPASAETNANLGAKVALGLPALQLRSDTAIDARISALDKLTLRIGEMKRVSDSEKASIRSLATEESSKLNTLRAKIHGDGDLSVARDDEKNITAGYRIYALIIPKGYIMAAADRIQTIGDQMTGLAGKLQIRVNDAQKNGKDTAALQVSLADISVRVAAADSAAVAAKTGVAGLVPDNGDASIAAGNKAAIIAARAKLASAGESLKAARLDIKLVIEGLFKLKNK
jgi:hypothetical protein